MRPGAGDPLKPSGRVVAAADVVHNVSFEYGSTSNFGHGRYVAFQMTEVAIPRTLIADILRLIAELRPPPDPAPA